MRDRVLTSEIEDGELVIRIGIDVLSFAAEGGPFVGEFRVIDPDQFAKDVLKGLEQCSSTGSETTFVEAMLDEAFSRAVENGSTAVVERKIP